MSEADPSRVVHRLADRGYNVDPEAASLLAAAEDPEAAIEETLAGVGRDALKISPEDVPSPWSERPTENPPTSGGNRMTARETPQPAPVETKGAGVAPDVGVAGDVTGRSTGTGEYPEFVALFRDRYDRLAEKLRGRVSHRSARSLQEARGGLEAAFIGLVNDIRSTRNGHTLIELEDPTGVYPVLLLSDREFDGLADEIVYDEVIAVEGTLADDGGILFAETLHFPDVPRTHRANTADRPVQAALVSDVHVGSKEFLADAWTDFADWLHTDEAAAVEYLLIAGDMVEGVGVYPDQDADLSIVDVYEQYERFSEALKAVPGDLEVVMIPGNHDAVRLAEPQPALDDDIAEILEPHDARLVGNPSTVTIESVDILMYHGTSFDEMIAQMPGEEIGYEHPENVMARLLRKRHLAPPYGGGVRIAPETQDYLVIDGVPDVFHAGHVHTVGVGEYRGVRIVNSGCWQSQTDFQRRNNLQPEPGHAPILDLDTLDVTLRKFV